MGRYDFMLESLTSWGNSTDKVYALMVIGSQARSDHPADDCSDLDLVMVVDDPDHFLQTDQWLTQIGNAHISFVEDTIGGGKERRVLFDGALDVDFMILSKLQLAQAIKSGEIGLVKRGYHILVDKIGAATVLPPASAERPPYSQLSEWDFQNLVQNFWYHAVWAAKKLIRGELWTAKSCVDRYMKELLLEMIECHAHALHGLDYDTWHSGRFLDEWAESWVVQGLCNCYAHYERADIKRALLATMDLFRAIAVETAGKWDYPYLAKADAYSSRWVDEALRSIKSD